MSSSAFDINAWEAGQSNHAQGEAFDVNKWEGSQAAPTTPAAPVTPTDPRVQFGKDAMDVAGKVGSRIVENVKGLPAALNPVPQTKTETGLALAGLPAPVTRMAGGILSALGGVTQVPAAIHDINASPEPSSHYQQAATDTAGDALALAALDKVGGKVSEAVSNPSTLETAVSQAARAAGRTGMDMAKSVPVVGKALKLAQNYRDIVAEDAAPAKTPSVITDAKTIKARLNEILQKPADPLDAIRNQKPQPKGKAPAVDAEAMKDRLASLENPTDADTLRSRLDELKNPQLTAQEMRDRLDEITNVHDAATLKARLSEVNHVQEAVKQVPKDATIADVAKKAKELKGQTDQFEQTFGQPLENYKNPDGSFNMRDFLQEVVKPGTEPPAHVISRVFGSDGVKLVQDVSGKPIEKWEATGPTKAERAAKLSPDDAAEFSGRVNNVTPMGGTPLKQLQQFAAKHASGKVSYLASGGEATVFDLGNGKVLRVASGSAPRIPAIEEVLQPLDQKTVKGATSDYHATVSPKVETTGITQEDVRTMTKRLADKGYQWDAEKHNLGKVDGRLVVIDPGGLDKIQ